MRTKLLIVGGAMAVAVVVLLVTLLAGPSAPQRRDAPSTVPHNIEMPLSSGRPESASNFKHSLPVEGSQRGRVARRDGDRLHIFEWDSLDPQSKNGVIEVTKPQSLAYFSPSRVLSMRADHGTLVAPDNQPRRGDLAGHVVLTLYESHDGHPVDPHGTRDVQMVVYLKHAHFDLDLGQITSSGPVHLTGPRVDFRGVGLTLNYNPLKRRLERLIVDEGEYLRLASTNGGKTGALKPDLSKALSKAPLPAPSSRTPQQRRVSAKGRLRSDGPSGRPAQFYRATFADNVTVRVGDPAQEANRVDMSGDALMAMFSFDQSGSKREVRESSSKRPDQAVPSTQSKSGPSSSRTPPQVRLGNSAAGEGLAFDESLMSKSEGDIVIHWTGPLTVEPLKHAPKGFAGPRDVELALRGAPALIHTGKDQTLAAAQVAYVVESGWLHAQAGPKVQMVLRSPELGVLHGQRLSINQSEGVGVVFGPGELQSSRALSPKSSTKKSASPDANTPTGSRAPLKVTWQDRLDLSFYRQARDASRSSAAHGGADVNPSTFARSSPLRGLRGAVFHGQVSVDHPQFDLHSDELALALSHPASGNQTLDALDATGHVTLSARSEDREQSIALQSQTLHIAVKPGPDGRPYPALLHAEGDVRARQPGMAMRSEVLDVTMLPQGVEMATRAAAPHPLNMFSGPGIRVGVLPQPFWEVPVESKNAFDTNSGSSMVVRASSDKKADRLTIRRVVASGGVETTLPEHDINLTGQRLIANVETGQLDLVGNPQSPARVIQPDGVLSARHIIFAKATQTAHVPGPGRIDLTTMPGEAKGTMHITWHDAMNFDNLAGLAQFVGDVQADTDSPTRKTRLTADELQLKLEPRVVNEDTVNKNTTNKVTVPKVTTPDKESGAGRLRMATARGNVTFTAREFGRQQHPGQAQTSLRLEGPVMTFDNRSDVQQVQVVGKGRMLITDHRPADEPASTDGEAKVSSRGDTLFLWTDHLTMDANNNRVVMLGEVQVIHRPLSQADAGKPSSAGPSPSRTPAQVRLKETEQPVYFYAQRLAADFENRGGMGAWLSTRETNKQGETMQPELTRIKADGGVAAKRGDRRMTADHLLYIAADGSVRLWADPGHLVRINEPGLPTPITGKDITWNLNDNSWNINEPGGMVTPINK